MTSEKLSFAQCVGIILGLSVLLWGTISWVLVPALR